MTTTIILLLLLVTLTGIWLFRSSLSGYLLHLLRPGKMERILYEDALKHLYKLEYAKLNPTIQSVAGLLEVGIDRAAKILNELIQKGLIFRQAEQYRLTPDGRDYALHILRAHRLWERYLADQTGISEVEWHIKAEKLEHELTPEQTEALSAQLGNPTYDPHGDPVPTAKGTLKALEGQALLSFQPGEYGQVSHLADEPPSIFAQLVSEGFYPGMEFGVVSRSDAEIQLQSEGELKTLSNFLAANVTAKQIPEEELDFLSIRRLSELEPGESAEIVRISKASRGAERRRLMDLGILPGTLVSAEIKGPVGDPTAYRIRGALIALRREQAQRILIQAENRGLS